MCQKPRGFAACELAKVGGIAHPPLRILAAQAFVERCVARRVVHAVALERAVEQQLPAGAQVAVAPANNPSATVHGEMWMTLAQNITVNDVGKPRSVSCQSAALASRRIGGFRFVEPGMNAPGLDAAQVQSLKSVGHQVMVGIWRANATACWPVPLPISSTWPV